MRHFLERWRKKYKKSLKHWCVTELGHEGEEHMHIHGILYTENKKDIQAIWHYGNVVLGYSMNETVINYITKYVTKLDKDHTNYNSIILTSAGIGSNYTKTLNAELNKFKGEETKETHTTRQGIQLGLPIYYRNKIYTEEQREKLWINKLNKQIRHIS